MRWPASTGRLVVGIVQIASGKAFIERQACVPPPLRKKFPPDLPGHRLVTEQSIVATAENFMTDVVEASERVPVLIDFWAPWCGPCQALTPTLDRIADEYDGRFILAKVNTDEQPQLAGHFQIRSLPTVMLVHRGEVVDQFVGVQSESAIKEMLDRHVAAAAAAATPTEPTSEPAEAPRMEERPEVLAHRLLEQRDAEGAAAAVDAFAAASPEHPQLKPLRARLAFVQLANSNPNVMALREALERNPGDSAARHALAAHHAVAGDFGTALAEWLELMRRDRLFGDEAARRSLVQVFEVLGDQDPLVAQYRRRMASLLH
jgi:putative thioredoxin